MTTGIPGLNGYVTPVISQFRIILGKDYRGNTKLYDKQTYNFKSHFHKHRMSDYIRTKPIELLSFLPVSFPLFRISPGSYIHIPSPPQSVRPRFPSAIPEPFSTKSSANYPPAADPRLASLNFIHALSTIETVLENFKKKNEELAKDIPTLQNVVEGTWRKESELAALRAQMTELERKIQLSLKPIEEEAEVIEETALMEDSPRHTQLKERGQPFIPSRLQQIADASGGRIVIGRVGTQIKNESGANKGIKM